MEPKNRLARSASLFKSPVVPLFKFDAIRSLLFKREPFKEGVKVQMRPTPSSPFMCRVNPVRVGHVLVLLSLSPLISDACCVSNEEEEEEEERRDGKKPPLEIS